MGYHGALQLIDGCVQLFYLLDKFSCLLRAVVNGVSKIGFSGAQPRSELFVNVLGDLLAEVFLSEDQHTLPLSELVPILAQLLLSIEV